MVPTSVATPQGLGGGGPAVNPRLGKSLGWGMKMGTGGGLDHDELGISSPPESPRDSGTHHGPEPAELERQRGTSA